MLTMDIFKQDAFSATTLSAAVDKMDYVPDYLDGLENLFESDPVRTTTIMIEERSTGAIILPFSERGTAPYQTGGDNRKIRGFETLRIANASRVTASELLGIRSFGSEVKLKDLQEEVGRRQFKIKRNFNLTREFHKFNCVTGALVKNADGSTRLNWATEFQQAIPSELDFDLDNANPATGAVRKKCYAVRRSMQKALKGVGSARKIIGLCGDDYWDALTSHPEVEKTYLNTAQAQDLRNDVGSEWASFTYGKIEFVNYRGLDDGSFGVAADKCKFFPLGAGIFRWAMSPGESFEHLGKMGQDTYSQMIFDKDRNSWVDVEVAQYPLPVCTMPSALHSGRLT